MRRHAPRVRRCLALAPLLTLCQCSFLYDLSSFDVEGSAIGNDAASDAQGAAPDALGDSFVPDADAAMPGEGNADASPQAVDDGPDAPNEVAPDGTDADAEPQHTEQPDGQSVSDSASGATVDAAEAGPSQADTGPIDSAGGSDAGTDAAHPPPANDAGLVAYYPFAETTGTTTADDSGNNETATMQGATFTTGVQGNAATMSGMNQYVSLPPNIVFGLTAFSVCEWVNLNAPIPQHAHIFDFGTGTNDYMFLTPNSGIGTLQFAITTGGVAAEQRLERAPTGRRHVGSRLRHVDRNDGRPLPQRGGGEECRHDPESVEPRAHDARLARTFAVLVGPLLEWENRQLPDLQSRPERVRGHGALRRDGLKR